MICVYAANCTDFSNNGIGPVQPTSCKVTETLNGQWELEMTHPIDEDGRWLRLQENRIIRAPVPAATTPKLTIDIAQSETTTTTVNIYKVSTSRDPLRLRSGTGTSYKILGKYKKGTQVIVLNQTTSSWYEVSCPDGKHGYMASQYLTFYRTKTVTKTNPLPDLHEEIEGKQLRDQPFRIYRIVPELTQITVYARHIFYDLLDNMITSYSPSASDTGTVVAKGIGSHCQTSHDFTVMSDLTSTATGVTFTNVNPIDAYLGDEGFIANYGGELARDWWDVYLVKRVGSDSGVLIREGKNLLGVSYDVDMTDVVTRIMPTGEDKNGAVLYLPELYVDSRYISNYTHPKWIHMAVSGAKESDSTESPKTKAQCYTEMRAAANAEFNAGCDMPTISQSVDFINCAETEDYAQYQFLHNIFLGDSVKVVSKRLGLTATLRMTQYTYDCLTRKYTSMTLGTAAESVSDSMVSSRQLSSGSVTGSKLALNCVGTGNLRSGSVGSLQIRMAAIQTAHIEAAAITSALIAGAAITTAKIGDAQVTTAKIQDATITAAKIARAAIKQACIADAAIGEAQIADAAVTAAKIALATITSAQIATAAIEEANIANLAVTTAKIADAAITNAKLGNACIQSANIADAAITNAKIAELAVDTGNIKALAVTNAKIASSAVTNAKIANATITGAKIASATIAAANITDATISTAKIALGAITTALIAEGAVGTLQIADASITDAKIVALTADKITAGTIAVERLVITGSDQSIVFAINEANGTAQLSQTTIDGGSLTQRSITADRIVAGAITANEIAANTIVANNIASGAVTTDKLAAESVSAAKLAAGAVTTSKVSSDFGTNLDLSSNTSVTTTVTQKVSEAIATVDVGGVNLVEGSRSYRLVADSEDSFWIAADELEKNKAYTLSVRETILVSGTASAITWKVVNRDTSTVSVTGTLDFTYGKQIRRFTIPDTSGNWALYLYAGISGSTDNVTVEFHKVQLEEGTMATAWSVSPDDTTASIGQVSESVSSLSNGMDSRVQSIINAMGLSSQYASETEFLAALESIELIRSQMAQYDNSLQLTFNRLTTAESGLTQLFSSFVFGDDQGEPYLDMSASESSVKMRLTNTRLAFVQNGTELAYFSDNKLYVTRMEAVEQISIGTATNGYLDMVTTPSGVGFKWRS